MLAHCILQALGIGRAAFVIDVHSVRRVGNRDHFGAQFVKYRRSDMIGGAVGAIDHDAQSAQVEIVREGTLAEFDVAAVGIVDASDLAEILRCPCGHRALDFLRIVGARRQHRSRRVAETHHEVRRDRHFSDFAAHPVGAEVSPAHLPVSQQFLVELSPGPALPAHTADPWTNPSPGALAVIGRCYRISGLRSMPAFAADSTPASTASASRVAATSCTRTMRAPFCTAIIAAATLPARRSLAGRPVNVPIIDLRDTPARMGNPSDAYTSSRRSRATLCSSVLPKPNPGSSTMRSRATPAAMRERARPSR